MCGRYVIINGEKILLTTDLMMKLELRGQPFNLLPRYNASPGDVLPVIAVRHERVGVDAMRWWLIPHVSKDGKALTDPAGRPLKTFNAKGETLETSKLYAPYFRSSRCLVPADAFFEWKKVNVVTEKRGKKVEVLEKQPYLFKMKDDRPFMFAGLFSVWKNEQGEEFPTFTIITTTPNTLMEPIHNRMPVIIGKNNYEQWLDRSNKDVEKLKRLLAPLPDETMKMYRVSSRVNSSRNEGSDLIEPLA